MTQGPFIGMTLVGLHVLIQIGLVIRVLLRPHREPASRIAWVVVILVVPALGIIAYGMLTGQLPYTGEPMSLLFQHIEGKAKLVHELKPELGPYVSLLVKKLMAVELENRLQTMEDVAEAIKEVQQKMK